MTAPRDLLIDARDAVADAARLVFVEVALDDPAGGGIPGAHATSVRTHFAGAPTPTSGRFPLPDPARLRDAAAVWRGGTAGRIVLYTRDPAEFSAATRAWFALSAAGVGGVSVLHGGLPTWAAAGGRVGDAAAPASVASVTAAHSTADARREPDIGPAESPTPQPWAGAPHPVRVLDADAAAEVARFGTLLDARSAGAYLGDDADAATGHVPGASHAPAGDLVGPDGLLPPPGQLRRWLLARRAIGGHDVGAYCGGGIASSSLVFAAALVGQPIALYVDSWSGWITDPARPRERGGAAQHGRGADFDCLDDAPAA